MKGYWQLRDDVFSHGARDSWQALIWALSCVSVDTSLSPHLISHRQSIGCRLLKARKRTSAYCFAYEFMDSDLPFAKHPRQQESSKQLSQKLGTG